MLNLAPEAITEESRGPLGHAGSPAGLEGPLEGEAAQEATRLPAVPFIIPSLSGGLASPSSSAVGSFTQLIHDQRSIARLLELMISRSGKTAESVGRDLGVRSSGIRQYIQGRRSSRSAVVSPAG
jgi:hypothetical protein